MTLSARQRDTLQALCRTIIPASSGNERLCDAVERRLASTDPVLVRRFALALTVVGHPLGGLLATRKLRRFARLEPPERDRALMWWRDARAPVARAAYQGLRRFILSTYYADEHALSELGWAGPLHEREPLVPWEGSLPGTPDDAEPVARGPNPSVWRSSQYTGGEGILSGVRLAGDEPVRAGVCIVGSGAGGAVAAARLAHLGHDVMVLEQGGVWQSSDFTERESEMFPALYAHGGLQATEDLALTVLQGTAVGGSALVNWLVMLRTPEWVLEEWRREHGASELSVATMAQAFDRIEAETHTRCVPDDAHSPANRALLAGAAALGWRARAAAINTEGCIRAGTCGLGCRWDAKRGPASVYLPRATAAGARIVTECRVERITRAGGGFRIECSVADPDADAKGRRLTIEAQLVVLAAGAVGTPAILLRSGLGGAAVGRFLRLHPTTAVVGVHDRPMHASSGIPLSSVCDHFVRGDDGYGFWIECAPLYPAFASAALPGRGAAHRQRMHEFPRLAPFITLVRDGAERNRSNGRVRIDARGRALIRYRLSQTDRRTLVSGVQAAARLQLAAGAREAFSLHETAPAMRTDADVASLAAADFAPNRFSLFSAHVMGSCRLGSDPRTSVCTPGAEVRGVPGLYVVDGSLLPTAPGVNPQQTIMALADVVAAAIDAAHPAR